MKSASLALLIAFISKVAKAQVPAGVAGVQFQFLSLDNSGPALCFVPTSLVDGSPVVLGDCGATAALGWTVDLGGVGAGTGPATQAHIGDKCLDVKDGLNADGATLQVWTCGTGNPNQLFNFNGRGTISWDGKNKAIDLKDGLQAIGQPIQLWDYGTALYSAWLPVVPVPLPQPILRAPINTPILLKTFLVSPRSSPCVTASSMSNGAAVVVSGCPAEIQSPATQIWTVVKGGAPQSSDPIPGPVSQIKVFGNFCLDLTDGNTATGAALQIWDCAPEGTNINQLWSFYGDSTIVWAGNSNVLVEIKDGSFANGNPIVIAPRSFGQGWNAVAPQ